MPNRGSVGRSRGRRRGRGPDFGWPKFSFYVEGGGSRRLLMAFPLVRESFWFANRCWHGRYGFGRLPEVFWSLSAPRPGVLRKGFLTTVSLAEGARDGRNIPRPREADVPHPSPLRPQADVATHQGTGDFTGRPACGLTLAPLQPHRVAIVRRWSWRERFCDLGSDGLAVYDLFHLWQDWMTFFT